MPSKTVVINPGALYLEPGNKKNDFMFNSNFPTKVSLRNMVDLFSSSHLKKYSRQFVERLSGFLERHTFFQYFPIQSSFHFKVNEFDRAICNSCELSRDINHSIHSDEN